MQSRLIVVALMVVAMLGLAAGSQAQTYTEIGGSGEVISGSFTRNSAGSAILISGSSSSTRVVYNVTNPKDSGNPSWDTLEMLAVDGGSFSSVSATLIRVPRTTGSPEATVCSVITTTSSTTPATYSCTFSSSLIDFSSYYYYVRVALTRQSLSETPAIHGIRVF